MTNSYENDLISIIVPIYNCEKYLKECIESLFNQTYNNIEIILVNDGSDDSSGSICDSYAGKDCRVKVIHQSNQGVSTARNNGIHASVGKYITFVDSDDFLDETYCEYLHDICVKNKSDISLTPQPKKINSNVKNKEHADEDDEIKTWTGVEAAKNMLYYKIVISSWNKMFCSRLIKDNKVFFDTNLAYGEGFAFVIKAFLFSDCVSCGNKVVYNYRVDNANSVMTNFKQKLVYGSIEALDKIKRMLYGKNLEMAWEYANWHTYCDCLNTIVGCNVQKSQNDLYLQTKHMCRMKALLAIKAPVSFKEKIKALMYFISPINAAHIINRARKRTFTKVFIIS